MRFYLGELSEKVVKERLSGKSFVEIGKICEIPNPSFIELVYTWKMSHEPITWRQQHLDLEMTRNDALFSAYWQDALSGDSKAAEIILKINKAKIELIQKMKDFPVDRLEEASKMIIEIEADLFEVETKLKEQLEAINKALEGFDLPQH